MSTRSRPNSLPEQRLLLRTDAHRWNGRFRRFFATWTAKKNAAKPLT
jgi:hypothetical protein